MIIFVEGKIRTRRWMDKIKYNYITEIFSENIRIINYNSYNNENGYIDNLEDNESKEDYENGYIDSGNEKLNNDQKYDEKDLNENILKEKNDFYNKIDNKNYYYEEEEDN